MICSVRTLLLICRDQGGMDALVKYSNTVLCMCMCAQLLESCPTLCNPVDWTIATPPQVSSVHGILQTRILEWAAMPSSRDLPNPGIKPMSLTSPALAGRFFTTSATWEALQSVQFSPFNILVFPALVHQSRSRFALIQEIVFDGLDSPMNNWRSGVQVFLTSLFL